MKFDAATLAMATGGRVIRDAVAGPVCTDTRTLTEGAWFLALSGPRFDGHDYLEHALASGAVGAVVERDAAGHAGAVLVQDTTQALQDLGRFARSRIAAPVVGLTGSSGKTTTRALTSLALSPLGAVHQTSGNLNNHLGVPLTLVAAPVGCAAMVVEMGTSSPGEIAVLADIAQPDIRMIINVGPAHLEDLGGLDGVAVEKGALFEAARPGDVLVVNADDARVLGIERPDGVLTVLVGRSAQSQIRITEVEIDPVAMATTVHFDTPEGGMTSVLPALGEHFAIDAAMALGAAFAAGVCLNEAASALSKYAPVGMRMRREVLHKGVQVFNDAYNANPASMVASLDVLATLSGRRVAVLGDMLELGPQQHAYHQEVVAHADGLGLELLVLVGERMERAAGSAVNTETWATQDHGQAGAMLASWLASGDQILLKGSRGARTEAVLAALRAIRENS